jgi:cysteine desulfurase
VNNSPDESSPNQATPITSGSDYLDSASSSTLHPAAREAFLAALDQGYADPRRLHGAGRTARLLLDNARAATAESLGIRSDEVSFTSSGTDAVHRGLLGLHRGRQRHGTTIGHSAIEHSAVFEAARWASALTVPLAVARSGVVSASEVVAATADAQLPLSVVAIQLANPEVGTIQPIAELANLLGDVPLFMDASAATGHLAWPDGWAAAAASAHKWGGPAGIGLLAVRKGSRWRNPFPADDRIDPRVSGFENVPAALAAAAALQAVVRERETQTAHLAPLAAHLRGLLATIPDLEMISPTESCLPHLVAFSCLYVDGEVLVSELDHRGFGVASGSACTSSTLSPSHVLEAMGVLTHGNVRVSLAASTTAEQLTRFVDVLRAVVAEIRQRAGLPQ